MLESSRAAGFDSMSKNLQWPVVIFLELFEVYSKLGTTDCQMSPNKKALINKPTRKDLGNSPVVHR